MVIHIVKYNIKKILPRLNTVKSERREVGLQIANFKERKRIQLQKNARKKEHEQRIDTDVWLG